MLKVTRFEQKNIAIMLLMYPLTVVSFKLFIMPLDINMTILMIFLVTLSFKLSGGNKYVSLILSLSLYIYMRIIFIAKALKIQVPLNGYGYFIKKLIPIDYEKHSLETINLLAENLLQKTLIYTLCIVLLLLLFIFFSSRLVDKYINYFNIIALLYFSFAWFNYIDVESSIILYLTGIMIFYSKRSKKRHITTLLIISIVILNFVSNLIPYSFINKSMGSVAPKILILRSDYKDRESFFKFEKSMYYPQNSRLGGSVTLDSNKLIMTVITAENLLYLRGRVKDTYTGLNWEKSYTGYEKFESTKRYGEKNYNNEDLKSAFISYDGIVSLSVFSPMGSLEYSLDESKLRHDRDSNTYYKKSIFDENIDKYRVIFTGEDKRIEDIDKYLDIPISVTDRTRELALKITKGLDSELDKVSSIKEHLINNYPYSLEINKSSAYDDFVDDFLFEEKRGYCTYFSSALAIMSRINAIPSRYVEGYIVSPSSYDGEKYLVTEDNAHAWTEVFIEGSGWIVVDSTPIYNFDEEEMEVVRLERGLSIIDGDSENKEEEIIELDTQVLNTSKVHENNPFIYISLVVTLIIIIMLMLSFYNKLSLSNREKALKLIYKIDKLLDTNLKFEDNKLLTVYNKMTIYNDKIEEVFENQRGFNKQKNAIIKDVTEILYNHKEVSDYDLINLEKYLKLIKKRGLL